MIRSEVADVLIRAAEGGAFDDFGASEYHNCFVLAPEEHSAVAKIVARAEDFVDLYKGEKLHAAWVVIIAALRGATTVSVKEAKAYVPPDFVRRFDGVL